MSINAGEIRSIMTLDTSRFSTAAAAARTELMRMGEDGSRTADVFARLEESMGASASAAQALAFAARNSMAAVIPAFGSAGRNAGASFVSGLRSKLSAAAAAGTAIGSAAYNALRARLKINSPSRVAFEAGGFFGEGFALGIQDSVAMSEKSVAGLANASVRALGATTHNHNNAITISLSGATIRNEDDVRQIARSLGKYINDANYGVS